MRPPWRVPPGVTLGLPRAEAETEAEEERGMVPWIPLIVTPPLPPATVTPPLLTPTAAPPVAILPLAVGVVVYPVNMVFPSKLRSLIMHEGGIDRVGASSIG